MRLVVERWQWPGWVIADDDVKTLDGFGTVGGIYRLYAYGFANRQDAHAWCAVFELAQAVGARIARRDGLPSQPGQPWKHPPRW